jgi:hydrogenase small subunit
MGRMYGQSEGLLAALTRRGMSRRAFLGFSATMAAVLALPASYAPRIAAAVAASSRLPVIWLRGAACGGDGQAVLAAPDPTVPQLLLDLLAVEYQDAIMAPSGTAATAAWTEVAARYPDGYVAVVEGAIPTGDGAMACTIGGRPLESIAREVCGGAIATIALGACAFDGGAAAARGGTTRARGVGSVVSGARVVNLPGCPVNVENVTATIVHYLTFGAFPPTDGRGRPLFAYGGLVHNQCERRAHFEFGEFALAWGDEGAQKGWCLYKLGCKGPETYANCPTALYAEQTSWNVKAGHGCIGCTMPSFWDAMGPAYDRLPAPIPFAANISADDVGLALVGGVGALVAAHAGATFAREQWTAARARRQSLAVGVAPAGPAPSPGPAALEPGPVRPPAVEPPRTAPELAEPAVSEPAPVEEVVTEVAAAGPVEAEAPPAEAAPTDDDTDTDRGQLA